MCARIVLRSRRLLDLTDKHNEMFIILHKSSNELRLPNVHVRISATRTKSSSNTSFCFIHFLNFAASSCAAFLLTLSSTCREKTKTNTAKNAVFLIISTATRCNSRVKNTWRSVWRRFLMSKNAGKSSVLTRCALCWLSKLKIVSPSTLTEPQPRPSANRSLQFNNHANQLMRCTPQRS